MKKTFISISLLFVLLFSTFTSFASELPTKKIYTSTQVESILNNDTEGLSFTLDPESNDKVTTASIDFPNIFNINVYWSGTGTASAKGKNYGIDPLDSVSGTLQIYRKVNGAWQPAVKAAPISMYNVPTGIEITFATSSYIRYPGEEVCAILTVTIIESGQPQTKAMGSILE